MKLARVFSTIVIVVILAATVITPALAEGQDPTCWAFYSRADTAHFIAKGHLADNEISSLLDSGWTDNGRGYLRQPEGWKPPSGCNGGTGSTATNTGLTSGTAGLAATGLVIACFVFLAVFGLSRKKLTGSPA